jgi:hypothetical protein
MDDFSAALEHEFPEPDLSEGPPETERYRPAALAQDLQDLARQTPESKAIDKLAQSYGGRDGVLELLLHADATAPGAPVERVAALMMDPANDGKSLGLIARLAGVSFASILRAINTGHGAKALRASMEAFYSKAPEISADVVKNSVPQVVECRGCEGGGTVKVKVKGKQAEVPCSTCRGSGLIQIEPDFDHQKLALEIAGVHKKHKPAGPGVRVQVNQQQNLRVRSDALGMVDAVKSAASRMLYGQGGVSGLGAGSSSPPITAVLLREPTPKPVPKPAMLRPAGRRPGGS